MSENPSPLAALRVRQTPPLARLRSEIETALRDSGKIWERMEHNHAARFCQWEGHTLKCRKPGKLDLPPGKLPDVFPFPGAADMEVKLVDEIINEFNDLLMVAARDAQTSIMPTGLDMTDEARVAMAQAFGEVREFMRENGRRDCDTALAQWADCAWEYGHGVMFTGWDEKLQVDQRTMTADQVRAVMVRAALEQAVMLRAELARQMGEPEGSELSEQEQAMIIQNIESRWQEMLMDPSYNDQLEAQLLAVDPELAPVEARRVMADLRMEEDAVYYVSQVLSAEPEWVALKPGVNVFYPATTTRIQQAPFVLMSEWMFAHELQSMAADTRAGERWDAQAVKDALEAGPKSEQFMGLRDVPSWVLSGSVEDVDFKSITDDTAPRFLVLTAYYRATSLGGVPAIFRTTWCESAPEAVLHHACAEHAHGRYPFVDYVREPRATHLWDSRGVGEISFSGQEELRMQANFLSDNASLTIKPPLEVPRRSEGGREVIAPGSQHPVRRAGDTASLFRKIDVGGDPRGSIEVQQTVMSRENRYWLRGSESDPIAKQNRWKRLAGDWTLCVRELEIMTFQLIQQFVPDDVATGALNGRIAALAVTREDIQNKFSLSVEFDTGVLDPKTVEGRMKMLREYVAAMDHEGLLKTEPLLRLMTMWINPAWSRLLVHTSSKAAKDDAEDLARVLSLALQGIESPYVAGKNHAARAAMLEQLINMPATDEQGQPLTDPQTGQQVPGKIARTMQQDPDVAALVMKRHKFETFQAQQMQNADTGRLGVEPGQPQAA